MRIFRDSVDPAAIPLAGCDGVFGYINGDFAWADSEFLEFAELGKQIARIDINGSRPEQASILDVERGDATPQIARKWVPQRNAFRNDAAVYCGHENLEQLFTALAGERYNLIVADWTGEPHIVHAEMPPGVTYLGTQYKNAEGYDESALYNAAWHAR